MTTDVKPANGKPTNINRIGLTQQEYRGGESTSSSRRWPSFYVLDA